MKYSILVADDNEEIRNIVEYWLKAQGHMVVCAETGDEAVKKLSSQHFDLIVTDVIMPDGDGLNIIMGMKKAKSAVRILVISGGGKYFQAETCIHIAEGLGADATLLKPFDKKAFLAAIDRTMSADSVSANER